MKIYYVKIKTRDDNPVIITWIFDKLQEIEEIDSVWRIYPSKSRRLDE